LKLEDELEEYYLKYSECYDFVDPYKQDDIESLIVNLFESEIINKGKEPLFEDYIKT
jgi:hypothetical protein